MNISRSRTILVCLITFIFLLSGIAFPAYANNETWTCPGCGAQSSGNFCANCGTAKASTLPNGLFELRMDIQFDENLFLSTYDVVLYLDDAVVGTLPHGQPYKTVLNVSEGKHIIRFVKQGDPNIKGTFYVTITDHATLQCSIHANNDGITIENITLGGQTLDTRLGLGETGSIQEIDITLLTTARSSSIGSETPHSGHEFVILEFEIDNYKDRKYTIEPDKDFEAYCDQYRVDYNDAATRNAAQTLNGSIAAGRKLKGSIVFEVPMGWHELEIEFTPSLLSRTKLTFLVVNENP